GEITVLDPDGYGAVTITKGHQHHQRWCRRGRRAGVRDSQEKLMLAAARGIARGALGRPLSFGTQQQSLAVRRFRDHFSWSATLSSPALTQASSLSPPGAPDTPAAPITSSPIVIGRAPCAAITLVRWMAPSCGLSFRRLTISPEGMRNVRDV